MYIGCMPMSEKCSKCGNELDTTGLPKWCKRCRNAYQKENRETKEGRDFRRGAESMRRVLAGEFDRLGSGSFTGAETAHLIMGCPAPERASDADGNAD